MSVGIGAGQGRFLLIRPDKVLAVSVCRHASARAVIIGHNCACHNIVDAKGDVGIFCLGGAGYEQEQNGITEMNHEGKSDACRPVAGSWPGKAGQGAGATAWRVVCGGVVDQYAGFQFVTAIVAAQ